MPAEEMWLKAKREEKRGAAGALGADLGGGGRWDCSAIMGYLGRICSTAAIALRFFHHD